MCLCTYIHMKTMIFKKVSKGSKSLKFLKDLNDSCTYETLHFPQAITKQKWLEMSFCLSACSLSFFFSGG